ncbi:hypothetical protein VTH06DRAFT_4755 [Thermothelomyces fergusii]
MNSQNYVDIQTCVAVGKGGTVTGEEGAILAQYSVPFISFSRPSNLLPEPKAQRFSLPQPSNHSNRSPTHCPRVTTTLLSSLSEVGDSFWTLTLFFLSRHNHRGAIIRLPRAKRQLSPKLNIAP